MSFLPIYFYFIVVSFLVSLSVYVSSTNSNWFLKLFPPFLFITIITETIGSYLSFIKKPNLILYNFFTVFEFCFYLFVLSHIISNRQMKMAARISILLYLLIAVNNIIFIQKMKAFHTVTYAFGCLLIVGFCIFYFFELFKLATSIKLINNPAFWICSGLLFFYCCGFPLYGLMNYLSRISILLIKNFHSIIVILNCFLYTLFTIAFLCQIRTRKYISSP